MTSTSCDQIEHDLVIDHIYAMLHQEEKTYSQHICSLDQDCHPHSSRNRHIVQHSNDLSRSKICEWAFKVVDHFGYEREIVGICMDYIDRYMSSLKKSSTQLPANDYQILSATSLYLAVKLHGKKDNKYAPSKSLTNINTFVMLSRGVATKEIIEQMEMSILSALEWRMNPPIPSYFVSHLVELFPSRMMPRDILYDLIEISRYLTELSACTSALSNGHRPSLVAFACLLNAMDYVDMTYVPRDIVISFLETVSRITQLQPEMAEVQKVRKILKDLVGPNIFKGGVDNCQKERCHEPLSPGHTDNTHGCLEHVTASPDCASGMYY